MRPMIFRDLLDRRSRLYQSWARLVDQIVADQGGQQNLSTVRLRLIEHLASVSMLIQLREEKMIAGDQPDPDTISDFYLPGLNTLNRLSRTVGLNRRPRKIPSLDEYLASQERETTGEADE